jgi:hypothetical protein
MRSEGFFCGLPLFSDPVADPDWVKADTVPNFVNTGV